MSRSIRKETSSLAFGIIGRFGGSSAGFVVAVLNAASAASREVVVLRVLSAGILFPRAKRLDSVGLPGFEDRTRILSYNQTRILEKPATFLGEIVSVGVFIVSALLFYLQAAAPGPR